MYNEIIERHLRNYLCNIQPEELKNACLYATSSGKRLRPNFLIYSYLTFKNKNKLNDKILNYAAAIEMIHAYSLIHDDLPAMDNDDFRRGKPTVHKKFGEAIAILAGDTLLNSAFEIMLKTPNINAMKVIAKAAGGRGMIAGQTADILGKKDFHYINSKKTAALFYASFYAGAILANEVKKGKELGKAGFLFGLYYQLKDDAEDFEIKINIEPEILLKKCMYEINKIKKSNKSDELYEYIRKITKYKP